MKIFSSVILYLLTLTLIASCSIDDKYRWRNRAVKHYTDYIPYDLLRPNSTMKLEEDLIEISGLTHIGNGKIAAVEDETGNIYILNDSDGEIIEKIKFHKFGDYEGITKIADAYYIAKSNGKIYHWENENLRTIKTELGVQNNIEGICYDDVLDLIYLVCKEDPGINERDLGDSRAVYSFDYKKDSLITEPRFVIHSDSIMSYVKRTWGTGEDIPEIRFKPSGIAVNPINSKIYIVNYIGRILIVLNPNGSIHTILPLSVQLFTQPEGICFSEDGTLYISNEGGDEKGYILKFEIKKGN